MSDMLKRAIIMLSTGGIIFALLVFVILHFRVSQSPPTDFEWPQVTVDYTYALPPAVDIIEGKADVADIFGDYSMCASFTLSEPDLQALRRQGLNWFPSLRAGYNSESDWSMGTLTQERSDRFDYIGFMLDNKPDPNNTYSYIREDVDGGWQRAVAINEESKVVYYCRISW